MAHQERPHGEIIQRSRCTGTIHVPNKPSVPVYVCMMDTICMHGVCMMHMQDEYMPHGVCMMCVCFDARIGAC